MTVLTRFTPAVKSVVGRACEYAREDGSKEVGEAHLLDALLDNNESGVLLEAVAGDAQRAQTAADMQQARRTGGLTRTETDALSGLGIDVGAVVGRIEAELGAGSMTDPGSRSPSRWQRPVLSGTVLRVLDEAERQVGATGRHVGVEHLALGIVSTPSVLCESLARRGVSVATVRASLAAVGSGGPR
jgi:ATP-dependent Clp protease ATP-binding subunit ClpA